jgi:hypothetical protein
MKRVLAKLMGNEYNKLGGVLPRIVGRELSAMNALLENMVHAALRNSSNRPPALTSSNNRTDKATGSLVDHAVPINKKIEEMGTGRQQRKGYQIQAYNDDVIFLNMASHTILARLLKCSRFSGIVSF